MPIIYRMDIISTLKSKGFSTYKLRKDKLLGEATIQKLRNGELVSWDNISTICKLLNCQPGDIIRYIEDDIYSLQNYIKKNNAKSDTGKDTEL